MFTGIIAGTGRVLQVERHPKYARLLIGLDELADEFKLELGESIAINGVCLTVQTVTEQGFWADISEETLQKTSLSSLDVNSLLNIERSLRANSLMGGHIVTGHVDDRAKIVSLTTVASNTQFVISVPGHLLKYIAAKGSLCVDGISLTVVTVNDNHVEFALIPHTVQMTNLKNKKVGDWVNVEVDLMARYCARLLEFQPVEDLQDAIS